MCISAQKLPSMLFIATQCVIALRHSRHPPPRRDAAKPAGTAASGLSLLQHRWVLLLWLLMRINQAARGSAAVAFQPQRLPPHRNAAIAEQPAGMQTSASATTRTSAQPGGCNALTW